ncbi:LCP family protein [Luteipulveratus halotolerans]|uniref:LCP family protein n=1 Tax=Luteipulveratus halotolerans TaxID=1631356 RepID=UPI000A828DA2|nr:LCP family protein [Luteipulveratus halotolerans]
MTSVRRTARTTLAGLLVAASVASVAGCSGDDSGSATTGSAAAPTTTTGAAAATSSPGSASTSSAAPSGPALAAGNGTLTPQVLQRLGKTSFTDAELAGASRGTWKGTGIAVRAQGQDVTLLVKEGATWKIVGGWWPSKGAPGPYLGGKRHVVALGSDARLGQDIQHSRADTIQVVGVDGKGGGGILGLPRDTLTTLPNGSQGKINGAMVSGGPAGMARTVSRTTGIPLQGYLLTDFVGFQRAVHAIGGITVTLKRPVKDVPAGTHNLTAKQALTVARERKSLPGGDFDRSANQGLILMSGYAKLRTLGPTRLPGLMTAISPHMSSDLTPAQVLTLLASAYQANPSRVGRSVADGQAGSGPGGASVVRLTPAAKAEFGRFRDGNL